MQFAIEVRGAGAIVQRWGRFRASKATVDAFNDQERGLRVALGAYPPQRRYRMRWVSERQRRYVMAAIRGGRISVPYRRTGRLREGWQINTRIDGNGATMSVTNSVEYAAGVMGARQWWMHADHWPKAKGIVDAWTPTVRRVIRERVKEMLDNG